ncbi:MAG: nitronate monooxygenase, partial [Solirubrobacterales bacterium]|nr:nitronate monooxygenase [Solirubrobacterales bacterium]
GGHVRGQMTTMTLVPAVADIAGTVPVVAAGGIVDGRGVKAALALGASGAMLGTRFLVAEEANTHDVYRAAIVAAAGHDATYTGLFDVGWPAAPHRVLHNSTLRAWEAAGKPAPGTRPNEGETVAIRDGHAIPRYGDDTPTRDTSGALEALALYAGQGVGAVKRVEPAAAIVASLVSEAGLGAPDATGA